MGRVFQNCERNARRSTTVGITVGPTNVVTIPCIGSLDNQRRTQWFRRDEFGLSLTSSLCWCLRLSHFWHRQFLPRTPRLRLRPLKLVTRLTDGWAYMFNKAAFSKPRILH